MPLKLLPVLNDLDTTPTKEELEIAIDRLPSGKSPGKDAIPAEVIKCGNTTLLDPFHQLLCLCWEEGAVPQGMRDSSIVTLYKNKGARSIVGKLFAHTVFRRLQKLADRIYPGSQSAFRSNRSTVDMIFFLRQLQENGDRNFVIRVCEKGT